jgi:beta-alanine degradation protein BauB
MDLETAHRPRSESERHHALPTGTDWPEPIRADFVKNNLNPRVGTRLLSVDERVRVWEVRLKPGERLGFHRHVLDYFWTAVTRGKAVSRQADGSKLKVHYFVGQTQHNSYAQGEYKIHDLENVGETELIFITVEFMRSANRPLPPVAEPEMPE